MDDAAAADAGEADGADVFGVGGGAVSGSEDAGDEAADAFETDSAIDGFGIGDGGFRHAGGGKVVAGGFDHAGDVAGEHSDDGGGAKGGHAPLEGSGDAEPGGFFDGVEVDVGGVVDIEEAGPGADGGDQPGEDETEKNREEIEELVGGFEVLAEENEEEDGESSDAPVLSGEGSSEFEEGEADEGDGGCDGDGGDEFDHATHQATEANCHFEEGTCDDGALHVAHAHLEAGVGEGGHSADCDGGSEEGEGAALNDGEAGAEGGLKEGADSADEEHGADQNGEFVIGRSEVGLEKEWDGYGGAKHGEVVLESEEERSPERGLVLNGVEHGHPDR